MALIPGTLAKAEELAGIERANTSQPNRKTSPLISDSRFPIREEPGTEITQEGNPRQTLKLVSAPDLLAEPEEARRYQWDGLVATGSINLLAAKPKVGKSTLALQLVRCTAAGLPFLGRDTRAGPALYVGLEGKRGEFKRSLAALGIAPANLYFHIGPAPDDPVNDLIAAINTTGAVLAVIDPLFRFTKVSDISDYAEVTARFAPLENVARMTDCALLLIHHLSKLDRDDGDQVLGSTAIFAGVDTALILRRSENGTDRILSSQQRYGDELEPHILKMDESSNLRDEGPKEGHDIRRAEAEIVATLRLAGKLTNNELDEKVKIKNSVRIQAIKALRENKTVLTEGTGKKGDPYVFSLSECLPPDAQATTAQAEGEI